MASFTQSQNTRDHQRYHKLKETSLSFACTMSLCRYANMSALTYGQNIRICMGINAPSTETYIDGTKDRWTENELTGLNQPKLRNSHDAKEQPFRRGKFV